MIVGKQGTGKSTLGKSITENDFISGEYCCIDLSDFGKCENACYAIPNYHKEIYNRFNAILSNHDETFERIKFKPRSFPTVVYVPAVRGIPNKLPSIFQPYRISFQDLDFEEFILLCGFRGDEVAVELLELAWSSKKEDETFEAFIKRAILMAGYGSIIVKVEDRTFQVNTAERRSFAPLLRRIKRLWDSSLICNRGDPLALDLNAIMLDKTKIHSFSMAYLTDVNIQYTIYSYLLRKFHTLRIKPEVEYPPLSLSIREVHKLAPSGSDVSHDGQRTSRIHLSTLVRDCRHIGAWIYMDTQDHRSVFWKVWSGVVYTWFIFRSDKIIVTDLGQLFSIPDSVSYDISSYDIGFCATKFDVVRHPCVYAPPLSLIKDYREQFMFIWEKLGGKYKEWDFMFYDTDELIKLSVPEQAQAEVDINEKKLYDRYIDDLMWICENYKDITIEKFCEMKHITIPTFERHIKPKDNFKQYLVLNSGIISKKVV
jgi:hypothetical protein